MIRDSQCLLSNSQAITGDAASTNYYDFGSTADSGPGCPIRIRCAIDDAFTLLTHLVIRIQTDTISTFASVTSLFETSVALAAAVADTIVHVPAITGGLKRYVRAYYDVVGTAPTSGSVSLEFLLDDQANTPTPDAL